jgi:hypothetical protein
MYLNNLTTNLAYEVKVRAATRSHVGERKLLVGEWSDTNAVFLQPGCEALRDFQPEKGGVGPGLFHCTDIFTTHITNTS